MTLSMDEEAEVTMFLCDIVGQIVPQTKRRAAVVAKASPLCHLIELFGLDKYPSPCYHGEHLGV